MLRPLHPVVVRPVVSARRGGLLRGGSGLVGSRPLAPWQGLQRANRPRNRVLSLVRRPLASVGVCRAARRADRCAQTSRKHGPFLNPTAPATARAEGFEPPTDGFGNRCSTV